MTLKTYLINKINSQRHRLNGIIPSNHSPSRRNLCLAFRDNICFTPEQLPPKVDLRKDMTTVEDQSQVGSCAANALAGAYEYLTKKDNGKNTDVSRLFIYYNARAKDKKNGRITDSGCSMASAIEALEEFGTCLESTWTYDISKVNVRPNDQAYQDAKAHTISDALKIDIDLSEMKSCLAQGYPFAFGLRLFSTFDKATTAGVVPMPDKSESGRKTHGCHALLAVGYSDLSKVFIVRNSWGEKWGDKGYCYIPYDYITDEKFCFDAWAIRKLANTNFGKEHWYTNDTVNYLDSQMNLSSYDYNDNNLMINDVDENDGSIPSNYSYGMNSQMNPNGSYDNYQQQYAAGGYQVNWDSNQIDQQPMLDNQLSQQNWNSGQIFNPPDQQLSSNQNFHQYNDQHNSLGQPNWNTNQFDQQQNWNNNQFSGGPQDQYQQQAWAPNQYGNGNFNNSQPDFLNQQYPNNNNTYQTDQQNMSFGQDMWTNNQMNQNNQAAWNNNQQNNSYAGNTFGNQYSNNYDGSTSNFDNFNNAGSNPSNYGFG